MCGITYVKPFHKLQMAQDYLFLSYDDLNVTSLDTLVRSMYMRRVT